MTIGPREVMRTEVEGLTGPAHPISEQSIDCGCSQIRCPKLARFATRRVFVILLCWLGLLQAAAHTYLYVTSATIARRFQIDPYWMEWILAVSDITPLFLGLVIAYWGDRIHRASWLGGVTFSQCIGYFLIMTPRWDSNTRVIEEAANGTHMSLHSEESQELCSSGLSRLIFEDEQLQYGMLAILIFAQIMAGVSNVGYYALGISYLDDNTKKIHVAAHLGLIVAIRIIGSLFGYILGWACLRIDSENLNAVESYREQIGAWWLGMPILAILLAIPATFLSWFPRRLPSEVVEQAAATILDEASGITRDLQSSFKKVGSTRFFPSILRLLTNKILVCNVFAAAFCAAAVVNFIRNENIFLESRFYAPRPTGMLLGFSDPLISRLTTTLLKPVVIGLVAIVSGLLIARVKPKARTLVIYSIAITIATGILLFSLAFVTCDKAPIIGEKRSGLFFLLRHCNYNCQCSRDADFRPVCDRTGKHTFYSPCHAGCTHVDEIDGEKVFSGCSCLLSIGLPDDRAVDGPCGYDDCQFGWMIFEIFTLFAYSLLASIIVGDLLINLRTVYVQDKALSIGFWMTLVAVFVHVPGKIIYQKIADATCNYWGVENHICHLHHSRNLGYYVCYVTALLLAISALIKSLVWWFCRNLNVYDRPAEEEQPGRQLEEITRIQREPLLIEEIQRAEPEPEEEASNQPGPSEAVELESVPIVIEPVQVLPTKLEEDHQKSNSPLKYGPIGPGDRRTAQIPGSPNNKFPELKPESYDTDNELETSSEDGSISLKKASPKVAYRPLEVDSDFEHDPEDSIPKAQKEFKNLNLDPSPIIGLVSVSGRKFPNPDDYENPRRSKSRGASPLENPWRKTGDFNEVGIPIVEPSEDAMRGSRASMRILEDRMLSPQYEKKASQDRLDTVRTLLRSMEEARYRSEQDVASEVPPALRPPSRGQASSGFGSLPDVRERTTPQPQEPASNSKENLSSKIPATHKSQSFICTDL